MSSERILSLDMSTKTGYALIVSDGNDFILEEYGQIPKSSEPEGKYPNNYIDWAYSIFASILELIDRLAPDILVIEETASGSKNIYSQKILEWIHFLVAKTIVDHKIRAVYMMTEQWRREVGCIMSKDEKKRNKEVKTFKEKNKTPLAYDINGKRIGKITRKHVNVRRANEIFGEFLTEPLRKKDEDKSDALLLGFAMHLRLVMENRGLE